MKLSCSVENPNILFSFSSALERVDKIWILHFNRQTFEIIAFSTTNKLARPIAVYGSISVDAMFEDYVVDSKAQDRIWLQVCGEHFLRAVKSAQNSSKLLLKLKKKDGLAILSLIITTCTRSGKIVQLIQDVPVRVLSYEIIKEYQEPKRTEREEREALRVNLPPLEKIRKITDKFKSMSQDGTLTLRASKTSLELQVSSGDSLLVVSEFGLVGDQENQRDELQLQDGELPRNDEFLEDEGGNGRSEGRPLRSQQPATLISQKKDRKEEIRVWLADFSLSLFMAKMKPTGVQLCLYDEGSGGGMVIKGYIDSSDGNGRLLSLTFNIPQKE